MWRGGDGFSGFLQGDKTLHVSLIYRPAKKEVRAPSLALYFDESGLIELFHVMGDGCRADDVMFAERAARQAVCGRHLLQDGEAARIGEGATDRVKLIVR